MQITMILGVSVWVRQGYVAKVYALSVTVYMWVWARKVINSSRIFKNDKTLFINKLILFYNPIILCYQLATRVLHMDHLITVSLRLGVQLNLSDYRLR